MSKLISCDDELFRSENTLFEELAILQNTDEWSGDASEYAIGRVLERVHYCKDFINFNYKALFKRTVISNSD